MVLPEGPQITQQDLLEFYRQTHKNPLKFKGKTLGHWLHVAESLIKRTKARTVLDYGCGKAILYKSGLHERWGVKPTFYDPGVKEYSKKPEGKFDGVICTDVLEHVLDPESLIPEIMGYATRFVMFTISCRHSPPGDKFPDGTPYHVSVHPPSWWRERIEPLKGDLELEIRFDVPEGPSVSETPCSEQGSQEKQD